MSTKADKARELFLAGANCAQAVLGAFCDECGIDNDTAMKIASGFGGGIGRMREVCGAVCGMTLAANLLKAGADISDKAAKDAHYALIQQLAEDFRAANGSIICRELLGLAAQTPATPVSEARTEGYYRKRPCPELVALAAQIAEARLLGGK